MKTIKEQTEVMLAYDDGKDIRASQEKTSLIFNRTTATQHNFNWQANDYDIVKEPRTFWLNTYSDGRHQGYNDEATARIYFGVSYASGETIKVIEVLE